MDTLNPQQQRILAELKQIAFTVEEITITLNQAVALTSPGGAFFEAQQRAAAVFDHWAQLLHLEPSSTP
ncbi:hypothetical protein H4R34_002893 [Dimargaris verticillata]|uniref:Uncharacterized protein n=1 Tax=Dimargaris verticillata TaxID=2761393 RepID=A0A9W8B111_9FUNG|nr:hypothetical protein H4R34_002893 [Dimargaris verticillata]